MNLRYSGGAMAYDFFRGPGPNGQPNWTAAAATARQTPDCYLRLFHLKIAPIFNFQMIGKAIGHYLENW